MDTSGGGASKRMPLMPLMNDLDGQVGAIADDRVDLPAQQPLHGRYLVDRPHLHGHAGLVCVADEALRHDARRARELRDLKRAVAGTPYGPSHPRPVEGETGFLLGRARQNSRLERTSRPQHFRPEGAERDAIDGAGSAYDVHGPTRELGLVEFQLDDD